MKINELAQRLRLTPRAIRLYEAKGLLSPSRNTDNGYRSYTESDAWRLQTISSLREMGISIPDIKSLLTNYEQGDAAKIHHELELQRMALASQWVAAKANIAAVDELIHRLEQKQELQLDDLFQLSERLRRNQASRTSWTDAWGFDRIAGDYDADAARYAAGPQISAPEYELALDFIAQWIDPHPGETGLDIGTGTGNLAAQLLARGARIHAIDQSAQMLARCRAKHPEVLTKLGNALSLPFFNAQFDFVASAFAFHHLDEQQQTLALEEMDRVLKQGGRICLAGPMTSGDKPEYKQAGNQPLDAPRKFPANRQRLLDWFRANGYITVQQQLNEWIHVVYAVRKH
ncbi:putative AdoMet-dependent methyltransferase [Paenibacillus phyllosphaerae]|uniref:Putative AdoMet-dependent methyltransferase n=1 Tax=Paenibacillus phyllosphaerae TaxID=274593 RepID=A0A7W5FLX4_9BACL|nr:MerR family transcriptional regulator [Paenibacillus phyllosphaerae]MBB3109513.1 putative AdoMet-dependent methyltransferase [Paenibacillus phyllosphaerae]